MEILIEAAKVLSPLIIAGVAIAFKNTSVSKKIDKVALDNTTDHKKLFGLVNRHETIMNQYTENESFFQQLENIAGTACEYINDVDAHSYTNVMASALIEFSKDILTITIDTVTNLQVDSKAAIQETKCKQLFEDFWDKDFSNDYFKKYSPEKEDYLTRIKVISEDKVNSKSDRFRAETILYMHTLMKNFILYYHEELM